MYLELLKHLGTGGTSTMVPIVMMFTMFTPQDEFFRHVADSRTGTVLALVDTLQEAPANSPLRGTLCNSLRETLAAICRDSDGQDPFCIDRQMIIEEASCA